MKLTIGMIVKNEEKYLDKCLSAIKPILDNVDSELIITDTGSSDNTVEIAKKYTDKVLYFKWNDDFSAARNTALEIAGGEWFMYLDADEIFRSCGGIIDFFDSGEYLKYDSASFVISNPSSDNGASYSFNAHRLSRISPGMHFRGAIHETLSTYGSRIKKLSDTADHYGYYYVSENDRKRKFERNSKLLLKRLSEEDPVDPMLYIQLYECYLLVGDRDNADKYMNDGIEYCKKTSNTVLAALYCRKAYTAILDEKYDEALNVCGEYFINCGGRSSDKELLAIRSSAEFRLKKYENAFISLKEYFKVCESVYTGELDTQDAEIINFLASADYNYIPLVCVFIVCGLKLNKYYETADHISGLPIGRYIGNKEQCDQLVDLELELLGYTDRSYIDVFKKQLDEYGKEKLDKAVEKKSGLMDIKLTVGMIVKNEERDLDRCLNALRPILENVKSELIITDTGSSDRTVEIAEKYTDKILHFQWCDDFSAARNTAFEKASGEWFMFVDADDVFTDCGELINFFNSEECEKFGSAAFTYRNIRSTDKSEYVDQYVIRIVRRSPQTKFAGRIHEVLDPMPEPIKALGTVVEHYGYLYGSGNSASDKIKRNERILLKELSETESVNNKTVLIYYYLYEEVRDIEPERAEQYLNEGKKLALKIKADTVIPIIHEIIHLQLSRGEYEAALVSCEEYFTLDPIIRPGEICSDTEIFAAKATALTNSGRYAEAFGAFTEFFRLYGAVSRGELLTGDRYIYLPDLSGEGNFVNMIAVFIDCCIKYDGMISFEKYVEDHRLSDLIKSKDMVNLLVSNEIGIIRENDLKYTLQLYSILDEYGKAVFKRSLCSLLFYDERKDKIMSSLAEICDDSELKDRLGLYRAYFSDNDIPADAMHTFSEKYGVRSCYDILFMAMAAQKDISWLLKSPDEDIIFCAGLFCDHIGGAYDTAEQYEVLDNVYDEQLPKAALLYEVFANKALIEERDISAFIGIISGIGLRIGENANNDASEFAVIISEAEKARSNGAYKECMALMKDALKNYGRFAEIIRAYIDIVSENMKSAPKCAIPPEMENLALMLKSNIKQLIAKGDLSSAKKILNEYSVIVPGDPETEELFKMIGNNR